MKYDKGDTLIPHEDFHMDTGERSFTKGEQYPIIRVSSGDIRQANAEVMARVG